MKSSRRVGTNQSHKKGSQNKNDSPSIQLPKINKTSNYDTNSNLSNDYEMDYEKSGIYELDLIEQNYKEELGLVNYEKITMEQIKRQYQRLRQQVSTLTLQIKRKQQIFKSKISKKPIKTVNSHDKQAKIAQVQQEVYENSKILNKLRMEYQQVQKRTNLANSSISKPNADMNEKVLQAKQKILNLKQKIKMLKRKTKKGGDDIVDGQNIHEVLQKMQRQQKALYAKQSSLQGKIQETNFKIQRQKQKLSQIQNIFSEAEDYLKLFKLENEQQQEKNVYTQQYKQKQHRLDIIRKKIESNEQTFMQKYHQLLKGFQLQTQKLQKINKKLIDTDVKVLQAQNNLLDSEQEWQELQQILNRMNQQEALQKQAYSLRKLMQKQYSYNDQNTFLTGQGFTSISNLSNHMIGVKSIIEENQSDLRQTLDLTQQKQSTTHQQNKTKTQNKQLFKRIESKNQYSLIQNTKTSTAKDINPGTMGGKYFLSTKQISKKRQQQKNLTSLRKQSSISNVDKNRKTSSVLKGKGKDNSKLKELSMNRTTKNQISIKNINKFEKPLEKITYPSSKQAYLSLGKNNHTEEIQKGKQILRQRKSSLKIVQITQKLEKQQKSKQILIQNQKLLQELQQMNKKLLEEDTKETDKVGVENSAKNTIDKNYKNYEQNEQNEQNGERTFDLVKKSSNQSDRNIKQVNDLQKTKPINNKKSLNQVNHKSSQPSSNSRQSNRSNMTGRILKPSSKQGVIRNQRQMLNPQISLQIDKNNIEYSQKIQQLKRQFNNKQDQTRQIYALKQKHHAIHRQNKEEYFSDMNVQNQRKQIQYVDNTQVNNHVSHQFSNRSQVKQQQALANNQPQQRQFQYSQKSIQSSINKKQFIQQANTQFNPNRLSAQPSKQQILQNKITDHKALDHKVSDHNSQSEQPSDDEDIQDDISQIDKMIKRKLQANSKLLNV